MMYWPISTVARCLPPAQQLDLERACYGYPPSQMTLTACYEVALRTDGRTAMVIVESLGAPTRRVYLSLPTAEEWDRLERAGFVNTHNGFGFNIDALH